jgi:Co/Zn/Cd efflux system component
MALDPHHQEISKQGNKVTVWGLCINLFLGIAKVSAGFVFGSKALLADGMHSLLDLISDAAVLAALYCHHAQRMTPTTTGITSFPASPKCSLAG